METKTPKIALVVEGGAMRGIFATGVLDAFMEADFNPFNMYVGVSAGSTALASYVAGMYQRNYKIFTEYSIGEDFISWKKFFRGGHLVDLDWLWDITIRDMRLDLEKICTEKHEFIVGLTDVHTGQAVFVKPTVDNLEEFTKASSALPIMYRNQIVIDGKAYVDGGLAAPIPVEEAYLQGAEAIMVIRSRPKSYVMESKVASRVLSKALLRKYPKVIEAYEERAHIYAKSIAFMRCPPSRIKVMEINPPEHFKTERLTQDVDLLNTDYELGKEAGREAMKLFLEETKGLLNHQGDRGHNEPTT